MAKTAIVIGGGIAGCSTAYALAKRGVDVTLIEHNTTIASAASGNPLAMLYPRFSGDDLSSQFALASYLYSLEFYQSLKLPASDFSACGMLQLGFNARELARIKKVATQDCSSNIVKYVSAYEASRIAGITIAHDALYLPSAAWVQPQNLCKHLIRHPNITVMCAQHVSHFTKRAQNFEVYNANQLLASADLLVIANANDAQQLLPDLPLQTKAVRGQVSVLDSTPHSRKIKTIICSDGYLSPATYAEQAHCLGASFADTEIAPTELADLTPTHEDDVSNLNKLKNMSSTLYQDLLTKLTSSRVSYRCSTSDYWPLVGELIDGAVLKTKPVRPSATSDSLPWISGLYLNVAHGSKGFTSAPMCAELLANMIHQHTLPMSNELASQFNPNRYLLKTLGLKKLAKTIASQHKISG